MDSFDSHLLSICIACVFTVLVTFKYFIEQDFSLIIGGGVGLISMFIIQIILYRVFRKIPQKLADKIGRKIYGEFKVES